MTQWLRRALLLAGTLVYQLGLARLVIGLQRRTPKVLLYHAVEETESDFIRGLSSNTPPAHFALHLEFLSKHYQVIPLSRLESGAVPDRAVVITFDDGYRSVYRNAFPLLAARRFPAVVYLVTEAVDNHQLVWVNALNWLLHRHPEVSVPLAHALLAVPSALRTPREIVIHVQEHYDATALDHALAAMYRKLGLDPAEHARNAELYVTWAEVAEMARGGMSFGSHTAHHPNLRCLDSSAQRAELQSALQTVEARGGVRSLAYPFGEYNEHSRETAIGLQHSSVMQVGGVNQPLDLYAVARVPASAATRAQFFAELEVVTPVMAWLKRVVRRPARVRPPE
jgi:peptidoglycan/xylan/chitin deacetylase (PgdA/CDA1 family)